MIRLLIILCLLLSGCAGVQIERDDEGRVCKITQVGPFPVKGKIGDCELDTKFNLFDVDVQALKGG